MRNRQQCVSQLRTANGRFKEAIHIIAVSGEVDQNCGLIIADLGQVAEPFQSSGAGGLPLFL
jgi:hypothetical protein